eukprot:13755123-Alexandrium_andersonii.AAC.1
MDALAKALETDEIPDVDEDPGPKSTSGSISAAPLTPEASTCGHVGGAPLCWGVSERAGGASREGCQRARR